MTVNQSLSQRISAMNPDAKPMHLPQVQRLHNTMLLTYEFAGLSRLPKWWLWRGIAADSDHQVSLSKYCIRGVMWKSALNTLYHRLGSCSGEHRLESGLGNFYSTSSLFLSNVTFTVLSNIGKIPKAIQKQKPYQQQFIYIFINRSFYYFIKGFPLPCATAVH